MNATGNPVNHLVPKISLDEAIALDKIGTADARCELIRQGYCGCALCAWGRELRKARESATA